MQHMQMNKDLLLDSQFERDKYVKNLQWNLEKCEGKILEL